MKNIEILTPDLEQEIADANTPKQIELAKLKIKARAIEQGTQKEPVLLTKKGWLTGRLATGLLLGAAGYAVGAGVLKNVNVNGEQAASTASTAWSVLSSPLLTVPGTVIGTTLAIKSMNKKEQVENEKKDLQARIDALQKEVDKEHFNAKTYESSGAFGRNLKKAHRKAA